MFAAVTSLLVSQQGHRPFSSPLNRECSANKAI